MWNLINAPQTEIFGIAIMLMLLLGVAEIVSLLMGGVNDWIDNLLPDSLTETAHAEVGLDVADPGLFIRFLSWLYVGKVPLLMLMVVFLAVFGTLGYLFQTAFNSIAGFYLNGWLAAAGVWFLSLPVVRVVAAGLYKVMPKDETTAIEQSSLVGRVGVVVLGEAKQGSPAQVRVKDGHGQQHYVMAEPDSDGLILKQGEAVLLVSAEGTVFKAIANPSGSLVD
ncbi:YqiJ family protein [Neisseria sp. Dent CA1/247]|uniref:YqiJ family protein n=1 Tax=Neisseria sp. Dent CA1/247 TaxID=2912675 RepID=UPI001FD3C75A|nr:YqiJ family protein [Neisseria sp. Dent CA1/247]UOO76221.1 YqiJ family protein [Neisseria sp. Dent CA1/247]